MPITNNNVRILDRKQWEMVNPAPAASVAGSFVASSDNIDQIQLYVRGTTEHYLYRPDEDGWQAIPSGALAGVAAGTAGTYSILGPSGTATAGTANTITVPITSPATVKGSLGGFTIRLTGGTGAGQERVIQKNTNNANSIVVTVTSPWTVTPDATTTFVILSGRFYVFSGAATNGFKYYDIATNAWSGALSVTGPTANFGTDAKLRATYGTLPQNIFATGTATGGSSTTLTNTAKAWTTNQWTNQQVRITGGTGAGQTRTIASNTGTVLTVAVAFTTAPDATSTYVIEGNDDYIYLAGNNSVTLYRYSISANTWTTLAPGAARAVAPGVGMSLQWVRSVADPEWTDENVIINGRRMYSFRGGGTSDLHYYDIPGNTWVTVNYQRQAETFGTGTSWDNGGNGKLYAHKDGTSRYYQFDIARNSLKALSTLPFSQGTTLVGDRLFSVSVSGGDGENDIIFLYHMRNSGIETFRMLIF